MTLDRLRAALADRYGVERELGQGGMATVYLARDLKHARHVAVKVLRPDLAESLGAERFLREIQIAAGLHHPHILPLYDSGDADGFLFYVMPYEAGQSLRQKLTKEHELPVADAVRILRDVVDALAHAHKAGVVHRDIKPDNVMLSDRHALVTDFGVAKAVSEASGRNTITTVGVALGTPAYMAPEQAAADPHVDHRADIYAVGVLGYEMLTGRPVFDAGTPQAMLAAHVTQAPTPVTEHRQAVPPALASLIMRCLEKKPADRWQSAAEMLMQLDVLATPSGGVTPTDTRPVAAHGGAGPWPKVVIGALVVLVVGLAFGWSRRSRDTGPTLDPNLIAIFPFRVTSPDGSLAYLGEGMVDLLAAMYTGTGGPRALDPRTTLAAWNRSGSDRPAEVAAPDAARALGAGQYLLGSVVGTGSRLVLSASVVRLGADGGVLARVEGAADSLSVLIEALVGQLLVREAGVTGERAGGLSSSLEAIRAYVDGRAANRRGNWNEGVALLGRAIGLDSSFTLAALALIEASAWSNVPVEGMARVEELAWASRGSLSARDQAVLDGYTGGNGPAPQSLSESISAWERAVSRFPDLAEAWYWLGEAYLHYGRLTGFEDDEARGARALEMAASLDPAMVAPLFHLTELAARHRDTIEAERLLALVLARDSTSESHPALELFVAHGVRDSAAMARAVRRYAESGPATVQWVAEYFPRIGSGLEWADTLAVLAMRATGATRLRDRFARNHLDLSLELGRPTEGVAAARRRGVWNDTVAMAAALYQGAPRSVALEARDRQARLARAPAAATEAERRAQYAAACLVGQWDLLLGSGSAVTDLVDVLRRGARTTGAGSLPEANPVCLAVLETMLEVRDGRSGAESRVLRLDSMLLTGPPGLRTPETRGVNMVAAWLLERVGRMGDAYRAMNRARADGGPLALSLRESGRLAKLAGNRDAAERAYRHYLTLRWNAEPSMIPQRDSVQRELTALVAER